jgi:hypothetical protein
MKRGKGKPAAAAAKKGQDSSSSEGEQDEKPTRGKKTTKKAPPSSEEDEAPKAKVKAKGKDGGSSSLTRAERREARRLQREERKKEPPLEPKKLEFKLTDCYCFKTVMDILKVFRESIVMRFSPEGLTIIEFGTGETSVQHYVFYAEEMLYYNYPFDPVEMPIWSIEVSPKEVFDTVKSDCKREPVCVQISINPRNNKARAMFVNKSQTSISMESANFVAIQTTNPPLIQPVDHFELCYKGRPADHKIYTASFVKGYSNIKTRNCNILSFEVQPGGLTLMSGKRNACKVTTYRLPVEMADVTAVAEDDEGSESEESSDDDSSDSSSSGSSSEAEDDVIASMGMVLVEDGHFSINLNNANILWFQKLARLTQTSIIKLYIAEDCPLIMRIPMSSFGEAIYSFNSDAAS